MSTKLDQLSHLWAAHRGQSVGASDDLVYSTQTPGVKTPAAQSGKAVQKNAANLVTNGVRVQRETKGRGGKAVSLVIGLTLSTDELAQLAKTLKAQCGSGGTVKDGVIEIQGDHVDRIVLALNAKGIKAKRSGG